LLDRPVGLFLRFWTYGLKKAGLKTLGPFTGPAWPLKPGQIWQKVGFCAEKPKISLANKAVKTWLEHSGIKTLFVAPGSPWENGYVESFNSKLRDELLDRELFLHIDELRYVADRWRMDYNHYRPHSSLDYMAPAAFAAKCLEQGSATLCLTQDKENMCDILS
jgi:hypothetical protein